MIIHHKDERSYILTNYKLCSAGPKGPAQLVTLVTLFSVDVCSRCVEPPLWKAGILMARSDQMGEVGTLYKWRKGRRSLSLRISYSVGVRSSPSSFVASRRVFAAPLEGGRSQYGPF